MGESKGIFSGIRSGLAAGLLAFAAIAGAAPAGATPIRVVIFNFCGDVGYLHAAVSSGTARLKTMLENPAGAVNLTGAVIPKDGFTVDIVGPAAGGNGTTTDGHALITALATHDVLILNSNTALGNLFSTGDKQTLLTWISKHGVVALHGAADSHKVWPSWDSLTGGLFTTHDVAIATVVADSVPGNVNDAGFQAINKGVEKTASFNEEWYSYQSTPRIQTGVHILTTLDEKTFTPSSRMGDHPFSWYRESPSGGRFYYTGAGHMQELFVNNPWFRRQVYNAIVWAAGTPSVSIREESRPAAGPANARANGSAITVSFSDPGPHGVEILSLDGSRVAAAKGSGAQTHSFSGLGSNAVYLVVTTAGKHRSGNLIKTR
ncbi:MAG: secreted glycosyl hydrolase [Fibrobacteres bacterium]|nr:secreted glycosyl hydrolase [Fibrobacterota bacterium]